MPTDDGQSSITKSHPELCSGELKSFGCLQETAGRIPSAVVMMTTADGMHPALSDLYRVDTEIAEVKADVAQSFF